MPKIILVTSGKGGTGKSTVSLLLGRALAMRGKNVLLVELDSGLRGLDLMLGLSDRVVYDLSDVLTGRCRPFEAIIPAPAQRGNLHLIAAPVDRYFVPDKKRLSVLLRNLSGCYDFLLLDSAAGVGREFDVAAAVAEEALVVATPDPVSLRDASRVAMSINSSSRLIINKFSQRSLRYNFPHIDAMIDTAGIQLISVIPEDELIPTACASARELPANSAAKCEIDDLAGRLLGERIFLNQKRLR